MAALAALTLIIGVYPNPFLNPIAGYIQGIFANTPNVLPFPTSGGGVATAHGVSSTTTSAAAGGGTIGENPVVGAGGVPGAGAMHIYKNVMANFKEFGNNVLQKYNYRVSNYYQDNNNNDNNYNTGLIKITSTSKGAVATLR
jgi:hypothetical protein